MTHVRRAGLASTSGTSWACVVLRIEETTARLETCSGWVDREIDDLVLESRLGSGGTASNAVVTRGAANLIGRRWRIEQTNGTGVIVDQDARADLSDISIRGTMTRAESSGFAAAYFTGGLSTLRRAHVEMDGQRGLSIKSAVVLEDVRVEGELEFGVRIDSADSSAAVRGTRVSVATRAGVGFEAIDRSRVVMHDLQITGGRVGINVSETAQAELEAFAVQGVQGRGLVLLDDAATAGAPTLAARRGRIESCELGVSLSPSADAASILEGLSFEANVTNARIEAEP